MVTAMRADDKVLLLTAFEGFTTRSGKVIEHNPTGDIAAAVARADPRIVTAVLPVSFARTRQALEQLFDRVRPDVWVGLGVAASRPDINIEALAVNSERATGADNDGDSPDGRPIVDGAPDSYGTSLDAAAVAGQLAREGHPISVSTDAGEFLCNQVFYLGCHHREQWGCPSSAAFVHVPLEGVAQEVIVETITQVVKRML